ncbi:MAG: GNAT family protein [Pseudomonadota bacterium]
MARIEARSYEPADLAYLRGLAAQASIRRADALPVSEEDAVWSAFIEARHNTRCRLIMIIADGAPAGFVNLTNWGVKEVYQIGYCVDEARQGAGVATQAVAATAAALFKGSECLRLQATVEPENAASIRVLEKAGFQREGVMRLGAKIGERLRDVLLFARLKEDEV